jgi:nitrite reductase/ring-hydroxylating ferredoxin subunit
VLQECPHSSYPLSNGTPFDIEDFGVVLSSGITCPQHDWSFDLHTGKSDRGSYRLQIWEVQQRPRGAGDDEMEVWVRRKQRYRHRYRMSNSTSFFQFCHDRESTSSKWFWSTRVLFPLGIGTCLFRKRPTLSIASPQPGWYTSRAAGVVYLDNL